MYYLCRAWLLMWIMVDLVSAQNCNDPVDNYNRKFTANIDSVFGKPINIQESPIVHHWSDPIVHLPSDWVRWYSREFRTERIPYYAGISAATGILMIYDRPLYTSVRNFYQSNEDFRTFARYSEFTGQGWFQFGLAGAFLVDGEITGDIHSLETASKITEVILSAGAVVQLIKHVTGRETPILASTRSGRWRFFPNQIAYHKRIPEYDAFPTGHLATATATLTIIMNQYPEAKWIPYVGYPGIACIGISMVGQGIHWFSDYPLGIAIGYAFAKIVSGTNAVVKDSDKESLLSPDVDIVMVNRKTPGISLEWKW